MSGSSALPPPEDQRGSSLVDAAKEGYDARRGALEAEDGRSLGDMLSAVTANISTLMQQEVALAKAELTQAGTRAGKGIGMFAGAATAGLLFLVFVSVSAWWGLGQFVKNQWSALIVAAIWAIVAGILAMVGKKEFERIRGIPQTTDTLGKIPNALKGQEEENR
jgi:hypothetical protein